MIAGPHEEGSRRSLYTVPLEYERVLMSGRARRTFVEEVLCESLGEQVGVLQVKTRMGFQYVSTRCKRAWYIEL